MGFIVKKIGKILVGLFVFSLILVGCGKKVDSEKTELYSKKAEETIQLLNEGKRDDLKEQFNAEMKEGMTEENFDTVETAIKEAGDFKQIEKSSVEEKDGIYITVTIAEYSKQKRVFTISYNDNEQIVGLFIK